jgi:type II secretory pathway pseudopilin PulG
MARHRTDDGFTVGQMLLTVALIGVLAAVAVPVSRFAQANAQASSCQTNQRQIDGAIATARGALSPMPTVAGILDPAGGAGTWSDVVRAYVPTLPTCPSGSGGPDSYYSISASGFVDGDAGAPGFRAGHQAR